MGNRIAWPWAALLTLCWPFLTAAAQTAPRSEESPPVEELVADEDEAGPARAEFRQELVVTAAHPGLPAEALVSGREIEQAGGEDLGYFLRRQAGLSSVRRGPIGLDPQVRGLQETQVAVFVDGTRTFAAGPGRMDSEMAHVSPRAVERMRVVKGPYALTWGSGALSAVRLETFRPAFGGPAIELAGRAGLAYGDNASTSDGYAALWGSGEELRFQLMLQGRSGDDYLDGDGNTIPGDYRSGDSRWQLGRRLGERGLLEYSGGYQRQEEIDYPGRLLDADYFKTRSHALELSWNPATEGVETLFAQLYSNRKSHRMNNDEKPTATPMPGRVPPFGLDVDLPTESDTLGGRLSFDGGAAGELSWSAGADFYRLEQTARRFISRRPDGPLLFEDVVWPDAELDSLGIWGQPARSTSGASLAATLRLDSADASAGELSSFFVANTSGAAEASDTALSAAVSARFRLAPAWSLTAGLGRAVRVPTALERYSDRFPSTRFQVAAEFMGDPGIEPETSLQADLGAELRTAELMFQLSGFYRRIDGYITVMPDSSLPKRLPLSPDTVFRYVNGDEGLFWGGELRLGHQPGERLEWRASASWIHGEDTLFDEPAFGMPPLTGRFELRVLPLPALWIDLALTVVDDQDRVATTRLERPTPGYSVADLRISWEPAGRWRFTGGVDNLGDRLYANHLNALDPFTRERIPEQGLNLHAAVEYRF